MTDAWPGPCAAIDERLDRLVNLDIGRRGVESLYAASREWQSEAPSGDASETLLAVGAGDLRPTLLFSTERVGRNADGVYCSMRGLDFGMRCARIAFVFDEPTRRRTTTVAVGDGGNEIGMGVVSASVRLHVRFGDGRSDGGHGIGATTEADVLMTAAVSNWGCYAIAAAMAAHLKDRRLLRTPAMQANLRARGVDLGLINSVDVLIEANVDGIPLSTHLAVSEMITAVVAPVFR